MAYTKQNFKSGQTLTAEHLNKIEQGIVDADNKSWNDLTDKPFGMEISRGVVVKTDRVSLTVDDDMGIGVYVINHPIAIFEGEQYTVEYVGNTYECVAQLIEDGDHKAYVLGNVGVLLGGDDTGEPFVFVCDDTEAFVYDLSGRSYTTFTITGLTEVVTELDNKFIRKQLTDLNDNVIRYVDDKTTLPHAFSKLNITTGLTTENDNISMYSALQHNKPVRLQLTIMGSEYEFIVNSYRLLNNGTVGFANIDFFCPSAIGSGSAELYTLYIQARKGGTIHYYLIYRGTINKDYIFVNPN